MWNWGMKDQIWDFTFFNPSVLLGFDSAAHTEVRKILHLKRKFSCDSIWPKATMCTCANNKLSATQRCAVLSGKSQLGESLISDSQKLIFYHSLNGGHKDLSAADKRVCRKQFYFSQVTWWSFYCHITSAKADSGDKIFQESNGWPLVSQFRAHLSRTEMFFSLLLLDPSPIIWLLYIV